MASSSLTNRVPERRVPGHAALGVPRWSSRARERGMVRARCPGTLIAMLALAAGAFAQPSENDAPAPPPAAAAAPEIKPSPASLRPELYLEVPVRGVIGREIIAVGVREVIAEAARKEIGHVVFLVDSPGGDARESKAIARVLAGAPKELQIHALIENEMLGEAMVFGAGAHTLHARPAARFGAGESADADDGSRRAGGWARELEALAEARGREPLVFRAAAERAAELYGWRDENGAAAFADGKPSRADADDPQRIDSKATVLSMTASELAEWGIAPIWDDSVGALGEALGFGAWRPAGARGDELMRDAAVERREIIEQIDAARVRLRDMVDDAEMGDPRKLKLKTQGGSLLTGTSQVAWREAADASIARWSRIREEMGDVAKLENRAKANGAEHLLPVMAEDLAHEADRRIKWLRANRSRHYIDLPGKP